MTFKASYVTMNNGKLPVSIEKSGLLLFLPAVFRYGFVAARNGQRRYLCGQKEPFAFLVSGSYAHVSVRSRYYEQMTLKAFYVTMNNGKLTVIRIE